MPTHSKEGLIQITDDAFAQRLKGNELFKEGDLKGALREYHAVLLCLKGESSERFDSQQKERARGRSAERGSDGAAGSPTACWAK